MTATTAGCDDITIVCPNVIGAPQCAQNVLPTLFDWWHWLHNTPGIEETCCVVDPGAVLRGAGAGWSPSRVAGGVAGFEAVMGGGALTGGGATNGGGGGAVTGAVGSLGLSTGWLGGGAAGLGSGGIGATIVCGAAHGAGLLGGGGGGDGSTL